MRNRLPNRRPAEVFELAWCGKLYQCSVGFYLNGDPGEVFIRSGRDGSESTLLLDDASVLLSLLLQSGIKPRDLLQSLGRQSDPSGAVSTNPSSILGCVVRELTRYAPKAD